MSLYSRAIPCLLLYNQEENGAGYAMGHTEDSIKRIARENGAALIGIASRERLDDAPPSADAGYVLPSTCSIVSFAVPLDKKAARDFLCKKDWLSNCADRKHVVQTLYHISDHITDFLKSEGHEAAGIDINNTYRLEPGAADVTEMTEFYPDFSHRYAAVAAGIGRLGLSGNVLTPQYGALVDLGTVLTSAELAPDPLLSENPCDRCKLCTAVCPVGMMHKTKKTAVTVAGLTDEIALKRPNTCCWIGCTGYHGLSPNRKWSNWSPYRLGEPLPEDKAGLDALNTRLQKADPQMQLEHNIFTDFRQAAFDPHWTYNSVCGNCRDVCWTGREDRETNARSLLSSGVAALALNGEHVATTEEEVVEIETPYLVRVALLKSDYNRLHESRAAVHVPADAPPIDAAVLEFLSEHHPEHG